VIRILYRHEVAPGTEAAFVEAWERCKSKMLGRAHGALEASLFRSEGTTGEFVSMTRWESLEDFERYWGEGIPDPEGERPRNQVLVEVKKLTRPEKKPSRPAKKR